MKKYFTIMLLAASIQSCHKDEPTEPVPTPTDPADTTTINSPTCNLDGLIGKLYCEVKDTTGLTGTSTAVFRLIDTTRATPLVFCSGSLANPYSYKHYQLKYYGWSQDFQTGNWEFEEMGKTYYRESDDCKLYAPLVNGSRCNYFDLSTTAWNEQTTSNHIQFRDMGDSIWVIDMHGDGVGTGAPDMYARDSAKYYLIH